MSISTLKSQNQQRVSEFIKKTSNLDSVIKYFKIRSFVNISEISTFLINHSSLFLSDAFFETYLLEIRQPNNYISRLFTYEKYTLESFVEKLCNDDLNGVLVKVKLDDKVVKINNTDIISIFESYFNGAIDIIFIFYSDDKSNKIAFDKIKKYSLYYKRYYIIHCKNIRELEQIMNQNKSELKLLKSKNDELNITKTTSEKQISELKSKNEELLHKNQKLKNKLREYVDSDEIIDPREKDCSIE